MAFNIDLKTLLICLVLENFFTVILIMSYKFHSEKNTPINIFVVSVWIRLIGWFTIGLRNIIPDFFSIPFANTCLLLANSLQSIALFMILSIFNKNIKKMYIIFTVFSILVFNYIYFFHNVESLRIAATFAFSAIFVLIPGYRLIKYNNSYLLRKIYGIFYCILFLIFILQAYFALSIFSLKLFEPNKYISWSFVFIYISMVLENIGFILLAKQKSDLELLRMSSIDGLTNIFNRRAFILNGEKYISLFTKKKAPISFILIDLDNFKLINDTYGHSTGDLVLKDFSSKIGGQLKSDDLFGRFGGEEFAIMLPGSDTKTSDEIAERLRKTIEESSTIENVKYTISLGIITLIPDEKTYIDLLYKLSDNALYEAKQKGRNRVVRTSLK